MTIACPSSTIPTRNIGQGHLHHVQCSSTMISVAKPQTASAARGNHFPLERLPWEMREAIWQACLPEDASCPRLYFFPDQVFDPAHVSEKSFHRQYISTALLRLAHVCHHSRRVAMRHITAWRNAKGQRTLCKRVLPERDCFFLSSTGFHVALKYAEGEDEGSAVIKFPWPRAMRYVAIPHTVLVDDSQMVFRLLSGLPSLRLLLINFQGPIKPVGPNTQNGYGMRGLKVVHLEKGEEANYKNLSLYGPGLSTLLETRRATVMAEAIGKPGGPWDPDTGELSMKFRPANVWTWDDESIPRLGFAI